MALLSVYLRSLVVKHWSCTGITKAYCIDSIAVGPIVDDEFYSTVPGMNFDTQLYDSHYDTFTL